MAIEIRELKIKGFINKQDTNTNNGINPADLQKLKNQIMRECKAEIKKALDKQKRR